MPDTPFPQRSVTFKWQAKPSRLRTVTYPEWDGVPTSAVWSALPVELVSEILIYMALASRQDAFNLCLVSSSVRRVILPCLYHNVLLRSADQVTLFAALFLPKRSALALLGAPPLTKLVAHVPVHSLALCIPAKRPSIEQTFEKIASSLTSVVNLAISAQLLSAHAHWLRAHPIRPRTVMLYHLGRPHPVNFREPFLSRTTHLYTSTLAGFRGSSLGDLPQLTHVALSTRVAQDGIVVVGIARDLARLLAACKNVRMVVLSLDVPPAGHGPEQQHELWYPYLQQWYRELGSLRARDPRLCILPYARHPRLEWSNVTEGGCDLFELAQRWRDVEGEFNGGVRRMRLNALRHEVWSAETAFFKWKSEHEWDLDLTQSLGYRHGQNGVDFADTDTPIIAW